MARVFVDGAAGTVGAALQPYLDQMAAEGLLEQLKLPEPLRKDEGARSNAIRSADLVVLCVPDSEAAAAVALVERVHPEARILDASAAHRCHGAWTYGLPEVVSVRDIAASARVANPGCFASACILAGRPLATSFGLTSLAYHGVTGYSAAGKKGSPDGMPMLVQFGKAHRHLPEIEKYTGATSVLTTMVGPWQQGMLVQVQVPLDQEQVLRAYERAYAGTEVSVISAEDAGHRIDPQGQNGTNSVLLCVAAQPGGGCTVAAVLDNLGKGSAGAAAANLRRMILKEAA